MQCNRKKTIAEEIAQMAARTDDEIRSEVSRRYGSRVRGVLEAVEEVPLVGACEATGCCGTAEATDAATAPAASADCCGTPAEAEEDPIVNIAKLYAGTDLESLPSSVTDVAFGCGNPTAIEALKPGEVVLDLGSGGGIDCFLAAKMVGPEGRVYGVDMTSEMIALARKNAGKVGATNVEFRLGEIEHLPIADASVDVIISNCVINLSPDKPQVFREAFRALRPGGRLQVSDVVWTRPVPEEVKQDMEKWAGCIAGALLESEYLDAIKAAGFTRVTSDAKEYRGGKGIASAAVVAYRPD
jgi:ubiquinone/menaquinone biosynthesis C-methylase UbiE